MTCQEFLSRHSDFLDGWLNAAQDAQWRAHMDSCSTCARHHRIVERSLALLGEVPTVEPASDFQERLQHRIFHLQDEKARHDRFAGSGTVASLAIAAVIALVAWGPVMVSSVGVERIESGVAAAEQRSDYVPASTRDMAAVQWYGSAPGSLDADGPLSLSAAFPGPYSPLIVEAPVTRASGRAARAVFAAYYAGIE